MSIYYFGCCWCSDQSSRWKHRQQKMCWQAGFSELWCLKSKMKIICQQDEFSAFLVRWKMVRNLSLRTRLFRWLPMCECQIHFRWGKSGSQKLLYPRRRRTVLCRRNSSCQLPKSRTCGRTTQCHIFRT